jgi:tyrosine-protein phosphatase SIW14
LTRVRESRPRRALKAISGREKAALALLVSLLVFGSCVSRPPARPDKWAQPVPSKALKNWYRVSDEVYRSEQPTREGFAEIRAEGIKTIVNLRSHHSDAALIEGLGLSLVEVPMNAANFTGDDIVKALRAIQTAGKPVLVHCQYGSDRTGVVIAMYRIVFEGWTREEALAELRDGGFGFHPYYTNIPRFILESDPAPIRERLKIGDAKPGDVRRTREAHSLIPVPLNPLD